MDKKTLLIIIILAVIIAIGLFFIVPGDNSLENLKWQHFTWINSLTGKDQTEKAGIYVPIKIEGLADTYWLQFDTGSYTQIYEVPFQELDFKHEVQEIKNSKPLKIRFNGKIGKIPIDRSFMIHQEYGQSTKNNKKIGTLGLDYFDNRVLIIDYPGERFAMTDNIPAELVYKANFVKTKVSHRGIKTDMFLEVRINNYIIESEFDTGSSFFTIVISEDLWSELEAKKTFESINAYSWGKGISIDSKQIEGMLELGTMKVNNPIVYRVRGVDNFPSVMGNAIFYDNYLVILDLKNDRFGYVKKNEL